MHITYHHRALDILCGPETFFPVTSARVYDLATDTLVAERDFIAVNKAHVALLYETGPSIEKSAEPDSADGAEPSAAPQESDSETGPQPDTSQESK